MTDSRCIVIDFLEVAAMSTPVGVHKLCPPFYSGCCAAPHRLIWWHRATLTCSRVAVAGSLDVHISQLLGLALAVVNYHDNRFGSSVVVIFKHDVPFGGGGGRPVIVHRTPGWIVRTHLALQ